MTDHISPKRQPAVILFDGREYLLNQAWEPASEDEPRSLGPFYRIRGSEQDYMPDVEFLHAEKPQAVPRFMHKIG